MRRFRSPGTASTVGNHTLWVQARPREVGHIYPKSVLIITPPLAPQAQIPNKGAALLAPAWLALLQIPRTEGACQGLPIRHSTVMPAFPAQSTKTSDGMSMESISIPYIPSTQSGGFLIAGLRVRWSF